MANIQMGGFRWARSRTGANVQPVEEKVVASAYGTGIFAGDCVKLVSDGTIAACAAGDAVYAVVNGAVRYKSSDGTIKGGNYVPASTTYSGAPNSSNPQVSLVSVTPVVGQEFEVDVDTAQSSITTAQDIVGNNANIVATAGSTTTGRSGHVLDGGSTTAPATTNSLQWRILKIVEDPLNDVTAANWKVRVTINKGNDPNVGGTTGI